MNNMVLDEETTEQVKEHLLAVEKSFEEALESLDHIGRGKTWETSLLRKGFGRLSKIKLLLGLSFLKEENE